MIKNLIRSIIGIYSVAVILTPWTSMEKDIIIDSLIEQKKNLEDLSKFVPPHLNVMQQVNLPRELSEFQILEKKINEDINSVYERYKEFKYSDELLQILKHAKRIGIEPELLMAIRTSENGRDSLAYGILPREKTIRRYNKEKGYILEGKFYLYTDEKEKQLCWAAWTIKKNFEEFKINADDHNDFISYLANIYAPIGAKNDPNGLNQSWEENVRFFYRKFKNSNP